MTVFVYVAHSSLEQPAKGPEDGDIIVPAHQIKTEAITIKVCAHPQQAANATNCNNATRHSKAT